MTPEARAAIDAWRRDPAPLRLACGIQHYAWGQRGEAAFIPRLLGVPPRPDLPYAELWIGAHPTLPARVTCGGADVPLDELVAAAPDDVVGAAVRRDFGPELPFLVKVLGVERPLSIQAHPDRAQAEAGFAREEAAGVPRGAPHRTYHDRNHKPELIVALTPFHALAGFRPAREILAALEATPELASLGRDAAAAGLGADTDGAAIREALRRLFARCMAADAPDVGQRLGELVARLEAEDGARRFPPTTREHWFLRAARGLPRTAAWDRGLLAFFLLNFVRLDPGQALFLAAGELHAYLDGVGVEVMASSDNVLRGGLTPKHVDVAELARVLTFAPAPAAILAPDADGGYRTPAREFRLAAVTVAGSARRSVATAGGPAVVLAVEGRALLTAGAHALELAPGDAVLIPAALPAYEIAPRGSAPARLFTTAVPP